MNIPNTIKDFIDRLVHNCPGVVELWAYGSRVNGGYRSDSDWDILVFGNTSVFECVTNLWSSPPEGIDMLIQKLGDEFSVPWIEKGYSIPKSLDLKTLSWEKDSTDDKCAYYTAIKYLPCGHKRNRREKAIRIYP
jgi:hypothetical protein